MDVRETCTFYSLLVCVWIYFNFFLFVCCLLIHLNSIQLSLSILHSLSIGVLQCSLCLVVLLFFWPPKDSSVQQVTGNNDVLLCGSQQVASHVLQGRKDLNCTVYSIYTFSSHFCRCDFVFPQAWLFSFTAILSCGCLWKRNGEKSCLVC